MGSVGATREEHDEEEHSGEEWEEQRDTEDDGEYQGRRDGDTLRMRRKLRMVRNMRSRIMRWSMRMVERGWGAGVLWGEVFGDILGVTGQI